MDCNGFYEPHLAAKARMSPLGSPSVMNMLAPLVRRMFIFAYKENQFMLLQIRVLVWGTGQALLRSQKDETLPGVVSSNWVGYIVCNTLQIVFNIMFVIYVGVNLQTIKPTLHNVI